MKLGYNVVMKIITHPNKLLRRQSVPVEQIDDDVRQFAAELTEKMLTSDGVGLAAMQVGDQRSIIAINIEDKFNDLGLPMPMVVINPVIMEAAMEKEEADEACLSLPGIIGPVNRHRQVIVNAIDIDNRPLHLDVTGWFARVLQHEIDHLNGVLFIDHIDDPKLIRKYDPKEIEK